VNQGIWRNNRSLRIAAVTGGITASLAVISAVALVVRSGHRTEPTAAIPSTVAQAQPAPAPARAPEAPKPGAKLPRHALRESPQDRARIARRLSEFGLKREFLAKRGPSGGIAPLVSQKDIDAATERSTFATVITSDHTQPMVSYSKLDGHCPQLAQLRGRAALKVNVQGKVIDGAYLPDTAPVPRSVIGCRVGKPSDLAANSEDLDPRLTFVTIYTP
jgi:hypothetical protein